MPHPASARDGETPVEAAQTWRGPARRTQALRWLPALEPQRERSPDVARRWHRGSMVRTVRAEEGSMLRFALWMVALAGAILAAVVGLNRLRFGRAVADEVRRMWADAPAQPRSVAPADLAALPAPVRRYADKVLGTNGRAVRTVRLRHGGQFRTKLDGPWLNLRGRQYFSADPPGFVWWGRVWMGPGLWFDVRDLCVRGAGRMYAKAESTLTVADAGGPEIDRGSLTRLLGEMVWFPTAYLDGRYVTWTPVDDQRADARLRLEGREVSARFTFGADDLPRAIHAERYFDLGDGKAVLRPWSVELSDYRTADGRPVPFSAVVSWHVEDRAFPYASFHLDAVEYGASGPFE